jgi:hypothetical protein
MHADRMKSKASVEAPARIIIYDAAEYRQLAILSPTAWLCQTKRLRWHQRTDGFQILTKYHDCPRKRRGPVAIEDPKLRNVVFRQILWSLYVFAAKPGHQFAEAIYMTLNLDWR